MRQNLLAQTHPTSRGHDITVYVRQIEASDKKEFICWFLRSAISCEYRKYNKAKILLSAGLSFYHVRCIHFILDHPNPRYEDVITYRLCLSAAGVILEPGSSAPDPEVAPILEMINLSKVENEFFNPKDFGHPSAARTSEPTGCNNDGSLLAMTETRQIIPTRMPSIALELGERPQFRFGGKYLEKYGFAIGSPVTMYLEHNKITLVAADVQKAAKQSAETK